MHVGTRASIEMPLTLFIAASRPTCWMERIGRWPPIHSPALMADGFVLSTGGQQLDLGLARELRQQRALVGVGHVDDVGDLKRQQLAENGAGRHGRGNGGRGNHALRIVGVPSLAMAGLAHDDPVAIALVAAIREGNVAALQRLLDEAPGRATLRIVDPRRGERTLLHVATDWPGYFPNGPDVVRALLEAGTDPNAPFAGARSGHAETPLHWTASSDDVEVARVLLDAGANLETMGASIAGGTPLDDAVGYGCWQVARLLVARGARVRKLWHAAGLGMLPEIAGFCEADPPPTQGQLDEAFWQACHGGQRRAAEYLYARGANPRAQPPYSRSSALEIAAAPDTSRDALTEWLKTLAGEANR